MWAKQSTAATLIVGPILDSAGAEYASAVIGDLSISKNGGTLTALAAAATLTHIANGQYTLVMTTGNLDTLGRAQITCNKSTYQMPEVRLMVVPAMVFDSMILGSDRFDVNVTHVTDTAQTAGDIYASQVAIAGYIDTEVSAIKAKTDQLTFTTANKVDSTAALDSASLRTALGMSAADLDSQLDAILAAASAGAGTGARTVTITVNDGTTVLQNAVVRFTEGSNTFRALTNASGVATFNLDDATYTVAVTKSGYTYAGTTMVVNGTETATYSMTANSTTAPSDPSLSAIEVLCLDDDFTAASGISIDFRMAAIASGDQNKAHPGAKKTVTSNGSGIARFEGPQGATIEYKRGTGQVWTPVVLDNDSVTNVTSVIGSP